MRCKKIKSSAAIFFANRAKTFVICCHGAFFCVNIWEVRKITKKRGILFYMFSREAIILTVLSLCTWVYVLIGFICYGKNKNMEDYILGGRSLNVWVAALSPRPPT
jgi:hypothetical protein